MQQCGLEHVSCPLTRLQAIQDHLIYQGSLPSPVDTLLRICTFIYLFIYQGSLRSPVDILMRIRTSHLRAELVSSHSVIYNRLI